MSTAVAEQVRSTEWWKPLREIFVRARFTEEQHFGQAYPEAWCEMEADAEFPHEPQWPIYLERFGERMVEGQGALRYILEIGGCALALDAPHRLLDGELHPKVWEVVGHLNSSGVIFLTGAVQPSAIVLYPDTDPFTIHMAKDEVAIRPTSALDVLLSLHYTWRRRAIPSSGTDAAGAVGRARTFLVQGIGRVIAAARAEAERDFDRAVAVSPDGMDILHADVVLVYSGDYALMRFCDTQGVLAVFPRLPFTTAKIVLEDPGFRERNVSPMSSASYLAECLTKRVPPDLLLSGRTKQSLCTCADGIRFFSTMRAWCPDPLPDQYVICRSATELTAAQ